MKKFNEFVEQMQPFGSPPPQVGTTQQGPLNAMQIWTDTQKMMSPILLRMGLNKLTPPELRVASIDALMDSLGVTMAQLRQFSSHR